MNAIPLINNIPKSNINNEKQLRQEINTSLVALKKEAGTLEGLINEAAQMLVTINNRIATLENDTVKKSDIVDVVQSGNMNPVTSNAVAEQVTVEVQNESTPYSQRVNADKDKSFINKLIGASFAVNQLVKNGNFANTSNWGSGGVTFTTANGVGKFTGSAQYANINQVVAVNKNNKVLFIGTGKAYKATGVNFVLRQVTPSNPYLDTNVRLSTDNTTYYKVLQFNNTLTSFNLRVQDNNTSNWGEVTFSNIMIIDLTQMFGSAIADRIYAMEQASAGSGLAWIKSFGFFTKDYYSYGEGSIINVHPTAYKISSSLVRSYVSRNVSTQYNICLYADVILKPSTNYKLYFRGANGAGIYPNEYIFTSSASIVLNGELQSLSLTTRSDFRSTSVSIGSTRYESGWIIFKNRSGNTVVPNFTEFYIVEEGINADPTYSVASSLASVELRGVPKLDTNNNLIYDGDIYYPDGSVIREYGIVNLGSLTWTRDTVTEGTVTGRFLSSGISSTCVPKSIKSVMSNGFVPKAGQSEMQDKCYRIDNSKNIVITNTAYTDATAFKTAMNGVYLVYELATPTKETVAGYSNPRTLIRKGTEEFVDTRTVSIPTGHETEYAKLPDWLGEDSRFL